MTVNKITTPPSQKGVIDKINEVIDNLGGGGGGLPSQAGNAGKFLTTDGTDASWDNVLTHNLFDFKWVDHLLNDQSWLRADTFSWQSGATYTDVYNHLVSDISGITAETETIGSYTVTFYRATDGHKVCLADQEQTVLNIYNSYGIAWYYILDTDNTRFKLPRTKYGFEGLRTNVGDKIDESLPNIKGSFKQAGQGDGSSTFDDFRGAFYNEYSYTGRYVSPTGTSGIGGARPAFDASRSSSTYQNDAPVQERATQMYLYFYVGEFNQTATEQTAGLNSELFNGKVDISSLVQCHVVIETYSNGASWYRIYDDGWCEQGGIYSTSPTQSVEVPISLIKPYINTNYNIVVTVTSQPSYATMSGANSVTTGGFTLSAFGINSGNLISSLCWQTSGYISQGA